MPFPYHKREVDLDTPRFRHSEVVELTKVGDEALRNWIKRGHIVLNAPPPGRGRPNLYPLHDVVRIAIMAHLGACGLPITFTRDFAEAMCNLLRERQANGYLFSWREKFFLRMDRLKNSPGEGALSWTAWGDLLEGYSDFIERQQRDDARLARRAHELAEPLSDADYLKLAREVGPAWPVMILDIGFLVNATIIWAEDML